MKIRSPLLFFRLVFQLFCAGYAPVPKVLPMPDAPYYHSIKKSFAFFFVSAAFCLAAVIRIVPPYYRVFTNEGIRFAGIDAYYHVRLIENLLRHYPHRINFDPYICFPAGTAEMMHHFWPPFFDWLLGSFCLLFGFGHPSQHVIDLVAAFSPAILGALTVFPVYFIGKYLLNPWCGVLAAFLLAVMPGEFLGRSILGFTDHHVVEVLFSTTAMAFLLKTIRTVYSPSSASGQSGGGLLLSMGTCLLSGLFWGMYLTTWTGALLFIIILVLFFIVQSILDYFKGQSSTALMTIGAVILISASGFSLSLLPTGYLGSANRYFFPLTLLACATAPVGLALIIQIMRRARCRAMVYPIILLGLIVILALIGMARAPTYIQSLYAELQSVRSLNKNILETWPLLYPAGQFSLALVWNNFGPSFILAIIALFWLARDEARHIRPEKVLLFIWSLVIFALTLYSRRFAYYLAINISLLTGWLVCRLISSYCFKRAAFMNTSKPNPMRPDKDSPGKLNGLRHHRVRLLICLIVVFVVVYAPCLSLAIHASRRSFFGPSNAWMAALNWMKNNTPEPFDDPDYYYRSYEPLTTNTMSVYPDSAYGVMAWWDYGHWIVRMAHRLPISTPFQWGAVSAGRFFTAPDESTADCIMNAVRTKYVIVDHETALAKFYCTVSFAGKRIDDYMDTYYTPSGKTMKPLLLFYPAYYRSLSVRLFFFDGKGVPTNGCRVYAFKKEYDNTGNVRKIILGSESFASEQIAAAYIAGRKSGDYVIAGDNPFVSPVCLEPFIHYRLIYSYPSLETNSNKTAMPPEIKIFRYQN